MAVKSTAKSKGKFRGGASDSRSTANAIAWHSAELSATGEPTSAGNTLTCQCSPASTKRSTDSDSGSAWVGPQLPQAPVPQLAADSPQKRTASAMSEIPACSSKRSSMRCTLGSSAVNTSGKNSPLGNTSSRSVDNNPRLPTTSAYAATNPCLTLPLGSSMESKGYHAAQAPQRGSRPQAPMTQT